jgi:DNA-3-methyladenine glycosylase I
MTKLVCEHGSFAGWLAAHHPRTKNEWVKLFRKTFKFTGPEVVNEFLMSVGYLPGAHRETCPAQKRINKQKPHYGVTKRTAAAE